MDTCECYQKGDLTFDKSIACKTNRETDRERERKKKEQIPKVNVVGNDWTMWGVPYGNMHNLSKGLKDHHGSLLAVDEVHYQCS